MVALLEWFLDGIERDRWPPLRKPRTVARDVCENPPDVPVERRGRLELGARTEAKQAEKCFLRLVLRFGKVSSSHTKSRSKHHRPQQGINDFPPRLVDGVAPEQTERFFQLVQCVFGFSRHPHLGVSREAEPLRSRISV